MKTKGIFYTLCIEDVKKIQSKEGLKIFGAPVKKFLPESFVHGDGLTRTPSLLFQMKDLGKEGEYNKKVFKEMYRPAFLKNLKGNNVAVREFKTVLKMLGEGKDVYDACDGGNPNTCHRRIIERIAEKKKVSI